MTTTDTESDAEKAADPALLARTKLREVELYAKEFQDWEERCKKLLKRYRDEKDSSVKQARFNSFWSNVETMKPALYARTPKPQVERKFKDSDPVGRAAADILERAVTYAVREYDFDSVLRNVRDDYLRVGRGQAWVRYVPSFEPMQSEGKPALDQEGQPLEQIAYEEVRCDYVHWHDFGHSSGRTWDEVKSVWRRTYLTKKEVTRFFGQEVAKAISYSHLPKNLVKEGAATGPDVEPFRKAEVIEMWCKDERKVYWLCPTYKDKPLKVQDDPLKLKDFFPCPRPLYATLTTDTLVPLPDYCMYQDQATELDNVTDRIQVLTEALIVCGVYDEACEGIQDLLSGERTNRLIPVKNWPAFAQGGGFDGAVQFFPLKDVVAALQVLQQRQQELKAEIYEITGISDIVRGHTNPNETATAQQIKGQFATLRISDRQYEVQRFARDLIALKAEIIAEHFQPETIALTAGVEFAQPEDQQHFQEVIKLFRNDALRSFRIDIETDSMVAVDEQAHKQAVNEYLQSVAGFMQQAVPFMQAFPGYAPAVDQMLQLAARSHKAGRAVEGAIEQGGQQTQQMMQQQQQQPPQPSPEEQKAQAQIQAMQQKGQIDAQAAQQKAQQEAQSAAQKLQIEQVRAEAKIQIERVQAEAKAEIERMRAEHDMALKTAQSQQKMISDYTAAEAKREQAVRTQQMKESQP